MVSLKNATLPSAIATFTPPGWRLLKAQTGIIRQSGGQIIRQVQWDVRGDDVEIDGKRRYEHTLLWQDLAEHNRIGEAVLHHGKANARFAPAEHAHKVPGRVVSSSQSSNLGSRDCPGSGSGFHKPPDMR